MAGSKTGVPTIYHLAVKICRIRAKLGANDMSTRISTAFDTAVHNMCDALDTFRAADNYPFEIDYVDPRGPEDPVSPEP